MTARNDRIAGALVGLAAGDALGAAYEFGPAFDGPVEMKGGGPFNWEPGEWTDDTQMALCIADQAASGDFDLDAIGDRFIGWLGEATDVGNQTRAVLGPAGGGADLAGIATERFRNYPRNSAGNGSLMRTGPVPLPFLGDRDRIAEAAADVSALTHADPLAIDACVLWSLAIDHAVDTAGIPEMRAGLDHLPADRRDRWEEIITEAEVGEPGVFIPNGFVVTAFQAAWSSIVNTPVPDDVPALHLRHALENAVRIGGDTDTVAAIAGTLLGAIHGSTAVPLEWKAAMHGWPGYTTRDLVRLAILSARRGESGITGWPAAPTLTPYYLSHYPQDPIAEPLDDDTGVVVGNIAGLDEADTDVVISLCRMGSQPVGPEHHDVWLLDRADPEKNPNLDFVVDDTVRFIAARRDEGKTVYLHCVQAQSRTPTVASAYLAHRFGISGRAALRRVWTVLPAALPNEGFVDLLDRIPASDPAEEETS